jgi:hypothetical protein
VTVGVVVGVGVIVGVCVTVAVGVWVAGVALKRCAKIPLPSPSPERSYP